MSQKEAEEFIDELNREHNYERDSDCLLVAKLRAAGLDARQIAAVLKVFDSTCPWCYNAESGCNCSNDE